MTRFARASRVFFFEEPVHSEGEACLKITEVEPNVWVCRPYTPHAASGFHDEQLATLRTLLAELLRERRVQQPVVWLYTPMALPLLQDLEPTAIVYDCMDELAAFKNPPKQLLQRESALLKVATLVFTGGPSLFHAKRARHPAVHCFPSSVDREHFAAALDPSIEHPAQAGVARPRLGFFGVIDERFDVALLRQLATENPQWQFVLVGPVLKIDPAQLARAANVHYFGQRPYADLPRFLAGWDVCLLPFALNEATRYISPTKTLEYMAAEKPIVSTAVTDAAEPYGSIVRIAAAADFGAACAAALQESPAERAQRSERMRSTVAGTSWDRTAARMRELIESALRPRAAAREQFFAAGQPLQRCEVAVIGAGPTGLSAAYHLGEQSVLFEKNSNVGGWCRSLQDGGFTFDYAGHIMFSNDA